MLRIVRAEDERRWDSDLESLLSDERAAVRRRVALAAGRIGDERAVPSVVALLQHDKDDNVRAMAAFALGEAETASAVEALAAELAPAGAQTELRARIIEALGKIAATLPATEPQRRSLGVAILNMLDSDHEFRTNSDRQRVLLGLTAVLRARPEGAGKVIAQFLSSADPRIRADAANALARLRANDGNDQLRKLLTTDEDPVVRANAARVLGATEDKEAFAALLERALKDTDSRVRVSAIRALASLKDARAGEPLLLGGKRLMAKITHAPRPNRSSELNEILEIASTLGRVAQNTNSGAIIAWLDQVGAAVGQTAPEVETAKARVGPQLYTNELRRSTSALNHSRDWRVWSAIGQGAAELANVKPDSPLHDADIKTEAVNILKEVLSCSSSGSSPKMPAGRPGRNVVAPLRCNPLLPLALPDFLRAYAAFKQPDTSEVMRARLTERDVIVRATAAELLGDLPPGETNAGALAAALPEAMKADMNDAALAILDSLAKQKSPLAYDAIKLGLDSTDHLIRRRAVALLKTAGVGDFSARVGRVQTRNTLADYQRAIARAGKIVQAVVATTKGSFTMELLADDAPLNVDNFIQLAKRGYFRGLVFHRVVPNFVIQGGDPRGDGNGGPGYQIRCEINEVPYERGAVGMALSGKDTGGSQWFVTHSPQPHLEGGYTVFGRVVRGMSVVDSITRGDVIRSITVTEGSRRVPAQAM